MPYSGPDLEEDNSASSLCQPSTSKLKDVEIESAEPERFQSPRPHVSCFTFLDDDEDCEVNMAK